MTKTIENMYIVRTFREEVEAETIKEAVNKCSELVAGIMNDGFDYRYQWAQIMTSDRIVKALLGWRWGFEAIPYMMDNGWV